jgi:hypothetical protein
VSDIGTFFRAPRGGDPDMNPGWDDHVITVDPC